MASYPNKIVSWTDKKDNIDDVLAEHINGAYHEIIAIETELNTVKNTLSAIDNYDEEISAVEIEIGLIEGRLTTLEDNSGISGGFVDISPISNTYTLDVSLGVDFYIENPNTSPKTIVFSNIPSGFSTVGLKIKFTAMSSITYPEGIEWIEEFSPIAGNTYYILFTSTDGGASWLASYFQG